MEPFNWIWVDLKLGGEHCWIWNKLWWNLDFSLNCIRNLAALRLSQMLLIWFEAKISWSDRQLTNQTLVYQESGVDSINQILTLKTSWTGWLMDINNIRISSDSGLKFKFYPNSSEFKMFSLDQWVSISKFSKTLKFLFLKRKQTFQSKKPSQNGFFFVQTVDSSHGFLHWHFEFYHVEIIL